MGGLVKTALTSGALTIVMDTAPACKASASGNLSASDVTHVWCFQSSLAVVLLALSGGL